MKREFTYTTTINGNKVQLTATVAISEEEINEIFAQKQKEFISSLNLTESSSCNLDCEPEECLYETYSSEQTESSYTPYSSVASNSNSTTEATSTYTPYASVQSTKDFPKSYHVQLQNGYAPYTSWRVNVPSDKKITIE